MANQTIEFEKRIRELAQNAARECIFSDINISEQEWYDYFKREYERRGIEIV